MTPSAPPEAETRSAWIFNDARPVWKKLEPEANVPHNAAPR